MHTRLHGRPCGCGCSEYLVLNAREGRASGHCDPGYLPILHLPIVRALINVPLSSLPAHPPPALGVSLCIARPTGMSQVEAAGYAAPIPQDTLNDELACTGDPRLRLSVKELITTGSIAARATKLMKLMGVKPLLPATTVLL